MNRFFSTAAVVLAAGKGERMKSRKAKVLHTIAGKPMLWHVLTAVWKAGVENVCIVVGFQAEVVKKTISGLVVASGLRRNLVWISQPEQLGTAHALLMAAPLFGASVTSAGQQPGAQATLRKSKRILVICGDVPLVRPATIRKLLEVHTTSSAACTVLTVTLDNPGHYGRIVRGADGTVKAIVEARDASAEQKKIKEVNSGIYVFQSPLVFDALREVRCCNVKNEYYLTDVVAILNRRGASVIPFSAGNAREVLGINNRAELAAARREAAKSKRGESTVHTDDSR